MAKPDSAPKELRHALFAIRNAGFARCFAPPELCPRPAIRAHSIQNAGAISLVAEGGHVVAPVLRMDPRRGPTVDLERVGRNRATTFAGLCGMHDARIFASIENAPVDLDRPDHRFLLAYRATFYETHATAASASQVQSVYLKRVELGMDPKGAATPAGMFAVDRMMLAWMTYRYKADFDAAYLGGRFDTLEHDLLEFDVAAPTLATSALFSLGESAPGKHDLLGVCATVLPVAPSRTTVVLSYLRRDAPRARIELSRVLAASGEHQKYEVSRLILSHCQNFVLAPSYVASWSAAKRAAILDLFTRTILDPHVTAESEHLLLFR